MAVVHYGSVRASAVNPARPGAPLRASGVDGESAAKRWLPCHECRKARLASGRQRRTGDMGDRDRAEWVVEGLQGLLLQVEISEIVMHEADEPDPLVDFLDAELLAGQHGRDVDLLAVQAQATAGGDDNVAIVEGIAEFRQAGIAAR